MPTLQEMKAQLWMIGDLSYKLWPQQEPIYQGVRSLPKDVETVVMLCARQFGKSHLGTLLAVEDCLRFPNRCILVMGPTIKQTVEIVAPRIRAIAQDAPEGLVRRSKSEGKWYIGESELVIGGFDEASTSQRGKTVQNIYIEEIVDSKPDQYLDSMRSDLGPALTHSDGGKMIFLTTLPKIPNHPFVVETIPMAKLHGAYYSYTIDDNKQLTQEQYDACVRRCGGKDTIDFRREYLNIEVRDPGLMVVPDYSDELHVKHFDIPLETKIHVSIDWGGVRDMTVALLHTYDFAGDIDMFWDEMVWGPNTPTSQIVSDLQAWEQEFEIWMRFADVPGQLQTDLAAVYSYPVSLPDKRDWTANVNNMAVRFSQKKVWIRKDKCPFLRQSLQSGTFNKNRTDFERTQALGHCDALAAMMYAIRSMDRTNPFSEVSIPKSRYYVPSEPVSERQELASAIQPKSFVPGRMKFGKFK